MNWIRENKFLTGFIAVMVIGVGGLGFLLYTAWGTYSDVSDTYTQQSDALHQLQTRVPYPDEGNLAKYKAERDDLKDATHSLAANLSQMVLPVEQLTPSAFQDRLRDTVSAVTAAAAQAGVALPAGFAMDFDRYQTSPPPAEASSLLGRQLAALKIAMDILIHERVASVASLTRTILPQEGATSRQGGGGGGGGFGGGGRGFGRGGGGGGGRQGGGGGGGLGGGNDTGGGGLVETYPFEIKFIANQPAFQKVLNDFAASDKQYFITRTLLVENTNPKPVARDQAAGASPTPPSSPGQAAAGQPATTGTSGSTDASYLSFIVGTEQLSVAMRIDMVTFNPPDKSARKTPMPR